MIIHIIRSMFYIFAFNSSTIGSLTSGIEITGAVGTGAGTDGTLAGTDEMLAGTDGMLAGRDGMLAGTDGMLVGTDGMLAGTPGLVFATGNCAECAGTICGSNAMVDPHTFEISQSINFNHKSPINLNMVHTDQSYDCHLQSK